MFSGRLSYWATITVILSHCCCCYLSTNTGEALPVPFSCLFFSHHIATHCKFCLYLYLYFFVDTLINARDVLKLNGMGTEMPGVLLRTLGMGPRRIVLKHHNHEHILPSKSFEYATCFVRFNSARQHHNNVHIYSIFHIAFSYTQPLVNRVAQLAYHKPLSTNAIVWQKSNNTQWCHCGMFLCTPPCVSPSSPQSQLGPVIRLERKESA